MKKIDKQWHDLKPQIMSYLEEGWSINVAFTKVGLHRQTKIFQYCFLEDKEFKEELIKYRKTARGFYSK